MRVTIKGITPATIMFNTIGIVLRGDSSRPDMYPHSIARHIDIKTEQQLQELNAMCNAKLVQVIIEDPVTPKPKEIQPEDIVGHVNIVKSAQPSPQVKPTPPVQATTPVQAEEKIQAAKPEKPTGKNTKNNKTAKSSKSSKIGRPKKIKKVESVEPDFNINKNQDNEDDKVVVVTENGVVGGKAKNSFSGEINDDERTKASIEALKQLEMEEVKAKELEQAQDTNDDNLDDSEKKGQAAIIATGSRTTQKVAMKRSIIPDADIISEKNPFFDEEEDYESAKSAEKTKNAFIPDDVANDEEEKIRNAFIDEPDPYDNADNDDNDENDDNIEC